MAEQGMPLHTKYRPEYFKHVVGQPVAIRQLSTALTKGTSRAFMLSGPSGVGKTTLARIAALEAGCDASSISEVNAASNTGVDAMRAVAEAISYRPFGDGAKRATIIDEAHGLSKNAWDSLLKVVEEPPAHALWFFCTTLPSKVPATIKTRVTSLVLKLVDDKLLRDLVSDVVKAEHMQVSADIMDLIVREAHGSPRQALVNLASCEGMTSARDAAAAMGTVAQSEAVIEICRFLMEPKAWGKVAGLVTKLEGESPESVRIIVCNYFGAVLKNATTDKRVQHALTVLEAFKDPYQSYENLAPLWVSIGRVLYP